MKKIISGVISITPFVAMAAESVESILRTLTNIAKESIIFIEAVAFAVFIYGIVKFILAGGSEDKRKEAKNYIIYGLIGMFVLIAMYGIFQVILNTFFGGDQGSPLKLPAAPSQ